MTARSVSLPLFCAALCLAGPGEGFAHKQHVHQYIAREGYLLLRSALGGDVPILHDHIGGLDGFYAGDSAWQRPFVTTGAWREDEEDVVFHHDWYEITPGLNYALVSISHFWDADQGDLAGNMFRLRIERPPFPPITIDIGPYENAFDKFSRYASGGWVLWYPRALQAVNPANGHSLRLTPLPTPALYGVPLSYTGLPAFFTSRTCTLRTDQSVAYVVFDETTGLPVDPSTVSAMIIDTNVRDQIVWEVLGRMCHLLADMSVPAHAHRDEHGLNLDSLEEYVGGASAPHTAWHHQNVGSVLNPFTPDNVPLHFLMTGVQQISDHYASNGPADGEGNNLVGGNPRPSEIAFLDSVGLASLGPPTDPAGPWTPQNLDNIVSHTVPLAIRATAGLLFWFSRESQLITGFPAGTDEMLPARLLLEQNFPNPFNPTTTLTFTLAADARPLQRVSLQVFDILGRCVATLIDGPLGAGRHSVVFDAGSLASGIYWYRLRTPHGAMSRPMVLTR